MKIVYAVDYNKWAVHTYKANFPDAEVHCGLVEDFISKMPVSDIILGGPPCQGFSTGGKGAGELDKRDGWSAYTATIKKVKPRMFLAENVKGILSPKHLPYFWKVLKNLENLGYVVRWKLQDAVNFGVPQFRKRVWVWGIRGDLYAKGCRQLWPQPTHAWPPPQKTIFLKRQPKGVLLPAVTVGQALATMPKVRLRKMWPVGYWGSFSDKHPYARYSKPSPTLSCGWIGHQSTGLVEIPDTALLRNFTPREGMRIQSATDDFIYPEGLPVSAQTNIAGNGWACAHAWQFSKAFAVVDPESQTCISLFCGGGLGDMGWDGRYWKPD